MKIIVIFDQQAISLYVRNDTRYGHSYNERRIVTRMHSIKWRHFLWPRETHQACDIRFFDIKQLENGTRQSYVLTI